MSRQEERAARREDLSGAGPTRGSSWSARWPGATAKFALFGEVLLVGLLVVALSVPIVTIPLAIAVGIRHLRRFVRAESSTFRDLLADLRRGILPSLVVGVVLVGAVLVLLVDLALTQDRVLPAAELVGVIGWLGLATVAAGILTAARHWDPDTGWLVALRLCLPTWRADPAGVLYLLSAVGLVGVLAWQLLPLVVPGIGCLLLAALAIPERLVIPAD